MDLAELKAGVADIDVSYKRHAFTVGYRPEAVTEDDLDMLQQFADKSGTDLLRATVAPLVRLLVRWSLTDGTEAIAVSETSIASIPPRMRVEILQAVMLDFFSSGNATASDAGSPAPAASEASVRSTPPLSGMRNGPASLPGTSPDSLLPAAV